MSIVAIVGRPNVGKSQLFNRLVGRRLSIVEDTPGVTRDRLFADCEWCGRRFSLVDTGGIEPRCVEPMLQTVRFQAELAIDQADAVILVTDIHTGPTAADEEVATLLQKARKPVVVAVNKADRVGPADAALYDFYSLGLGEPIPVSALHGHGTGDLLDAVTALLPAESADEEEEVVRVAIIGRPNVGKSSLLNRILGEDRVIVSDVPGTTRDAVDTAFTHKTGRYVLIDTAGMRKKARVDENIEYYSVLRAQMAIERSQVCLILLDAEQGVTEQDTKVAGLALEAGKACILVVNKWDVIDKDEKTMDKYREKVRAELSFMPFAPMLFISAKTGQRVENLFAVIRHVVEQARIRISTGALNDVLADAQARQQPPTDKGRRLKIYYITQTGVAPPGFVLFCNDAELFHFSYRRYLENRLRETFGFEGTPIRMTIRQKGDDAG